MSARRRYNFETPPPSCHVCDYEFGGKRIYCVLKEGEGVVALCSTDCFAAYQRSKKSSSAMFGEI
ncbi:hypothetical protein [Pelagicoccus sp. SDUM812002]|uniref:hypothetical protein n=1 Tax=Pelagicoccus sp. SDUM812002 TaxID=3041266 RepID=UPI00280DE253|nr:hypothetical protein [Pelagicoccus sp. SDUM812002]MDQ8188083.1 hypothetical protein [Pelagicoccus sp. SDUM812002]